MGITLFSIFGAMSVWRESHAKAREIERDE
jgi:hypothetical protein